MTTETDRPVVPWSQEAEQGILGALLADNAAVDAIGDAGLEARHFYDSRHREVFEALMTLITHKRPADVVSVAEALKDSGIGGDDGVPRVLEALTVFAPSPSSVGHYAEIVVERATSRALIAAIDTAADIARSSGAAAERLDRVLSLLGGLERRSVRGSTPIRLAEAISVRLAHWEGLENGALVSGLRTGFEVLDNAMGGLRPGALVVIGARPSVGKTSFAQHILQVVGASGHPSLMLSMEMQAGDLADRAAASLGGVPMRALVSGRFADGDWGRIAALSDEVASLPIFIDDTPALTLLQIRAKARQVKGLKLLVVDYVQLAGATGREQSRHHQIEGISRGLKALAKEMGICVLLLSQLTRSSTQRAEGEPTLTDLKESGAIEEDADVVLCLHPKGESRAEGQLVAAILLKNRQGRRGRVGLEFDGNLQRWSESSADVSRRGA